MGFKCLRATFSHIYYGRDDFNLALGAAAILWFAVQSETGYYTLSPRQISWSTESFIVRFTAKK